MRAGDQSVRRTEYRARLCKVERHGSDSKFFGKAQQPTHGPPVPAGDSKLRSVLRTCTIHWKMLVETRPTRPTRWSPESSAGTAIEVWKKCHRPKSRCVEIYAPFHAPYEFFENMGIRVLAE